MTNRLLHDRAGQGTRSVQAGGLRGGGPDLARCHSLVARRAFPGWGETRERLQ